MHGAIDSVQTSSVYSLRTLSLGTSIGNDSTFKTSIHELEYNKDGTELKK